MKTKETIKPMIALTISEGYNAQRYAANERNTNLKVEGIVHLSNHLELTSSIHYQLVKKYSYVSFNN